MLIQQTTADDFTPGQRTTPLKGGVLSTLITTLALLLLPLGQTAHGQDEEEEIPPPENVTVTTRDGVNIHCTYYGSLEGKDSVPIILLHGWEGSRADFDGLASQLQEAGHSVIVPDLRGHGQSTTRTVAQGREVDLDPDRFRRDDFAAMAQQDVQAVKSYLMDRNNEGELNIELLTVIGVDMGATIAANWAVVDWSWPQLPTIKQGQDVKAMILLSPPTSFQGLTLQEVVAHHVVRSQLSTLIMVGERDRRTASEASRLHNSLVRFHDPLPEDPQERIEEQDLFYIPLDTDLQGIDLIDARGLDVPRKILGFIDLRLVRHAEDMPWTERRRGG